MNQDDYNNRWYYVCVDDLYGVFQVSQLNNQFSIKIHKIGRYLATCKHEILSSVTFKYAIWNPAYCSATFSTTIKDHWHCSLENGQNSSGKPMVKSFQK